MKNASISFYLAITVSELWPFENLKKLRNFGVYILVEVSIWISTTWWVSLLVDQ